MNANAIIGVFISKSIILFLVRNKVISLDLSIKSIFDHVNERLGFSWAFWSNAEKHS